MQKDCKKFPVGALSIEILYFLFACLCICICIFVYLYFCVCKGLQKVPRWGIIYRGPGWLLPFWPPLFYSLPMPRIRYFLGGGWYQDGQGGFLFQLRVIPEPTRTYPGRTQVRKHHIRKIFWSALRGKLFDEIRAHVGLLVNMQLLPKRKIKGRFFLRERK